VEIEKAIACVVSTSAKTEILLKGTDMMKPAPKLLVAALLLLGGCAVFTPAPQPELNSPAASPGAEAPTEATESPAAQVPANSDELPDALTDTTVIPGERVGPVTRDTSREALAQLFGEDNLTDEEVSVGEGFTQPGTVVDLGEERSFSIVWTDESRSQPQEVRDLGSAWTTPQGIGVGTPFSELQQKLGAFELYGLGWDYGGTVAFEDSKLSQYQDLLILRVQPTEESAKNSSSALQAVSGDSLFPSSDPNFQDLDLEVAEMIVYLTPPAE
jgi:hypothetical protein